MRRLIDLSASLGEPGLSCPPGFPRVELYTFHQHETHGRQNSQVTMAIHQGTHIDSPRHFFPDGKTIDELPLETFEGRAVRLDLRGRAKPGEPIRVEDIRACPGFSEQKLRGAIAVTQTGWAERAVYTEDYFRTNPYLDPEAGRYLVGLGIKALAMDHPIDPGVSPGFRPSKEDSPGHRAVLGAGVPLIEHLVNLETFDALEFELIAFPVKFHRCEGAPARVVAVVEE
ncbi:MAG: cyclase family protein [Nitrospinota bacterium]